MPLSALDHRIALPKPVHAQTPAALEAVEAMVAQGIARRLAADLSSMVTDHGRPPVEPYGADPVTASARRMLADADAHGWKTNLIELADRCVVEGVRGTTAFRAIWTRGKAAGARWHERDYRYEYVDDPRPEPKKAAITKLSLANRRPVGVSKTHLRIAASPMGVPIAMATLTQRIKETS